VVQILLGVGVALAVAWVALAAILLAAKPHGNLQAIIVILVLRSTVRGAGVEAMRAHWPGSDDGFTALLRLVGLPTEDRAE
jgi:hypothetical protein